MTINELLTEVDDLKPNLYDDRQKIKWINQVEGRIIKEILETHEPDKELEEQNLLQGERTEDTESSGDVEETEDAEGAENTENGPSKEETGWKLVKPMEKRRPVYEFKGYNEETNMDTELIAKEPYTDLYKFYLISMINLYNEEYDRYQNAAMLFNNAYQDYANYYNRTHKSAYPRRFWT